MNLAIIYYYYLFMRNIQLTFEVNDAKAMFLDENFDMFVF